jgi:hypothetical protein
MAQFNASQAKASRLEETVRGWHKRASDHGFNRPAACRDAAELRKKLKLNLHAYAPKITAAQHEALHGPPPSPDDEAALKEFSARFKLEPFQRGMKELAPKVWLTALRKAQNPRRAGLDIVSHDPNVGALKVSPVFYFTDADMEAYLNQHDLPNEWDYYDPAKADERRECGLHVAWAAKSEVRNSNECRNPKSETRRNRPVPRPDLRGTFSAFEFRICFGFQPPVSAENPKLPPCPQFAPLNHDLPFPSHRNPALQHLRLRGRRQVHADWPAAVRLKVAHGSPA